MKKKTTKTKKSNASKKGKKLYCEKCGIVVTVDTICGCVEPCDLICCGEPLKEKK
ncbi:MAG: hypothetical protein N3E50_03395 [Candidatus Goldbacteria bacterium]|nr:hypothetical protein [Candidatus Goldiibacteriota bacterium]